MAVNKYMILFVFLFSCLCFVSCDLNLNEDEPCVTNGLNGTCVGIFRCTSASLTYLYANAGFDTKKYNLSELPDVCSYKNNEPVVCCTDCKITRREKFRHHVVGPFAHSQKPCESIALKKCNENIRRLPYPCLDWDSYRFKTWQEDKKCHEFDLSLPAYINGGTPFEDEDYDEDEEEDEDKFRWEAPHVALIGYGDDVESAQWLCRGSVISERFILTAAHCSSAPALGNISFAALGLLKRTDPEKYWKTYKIKRIIVHPQYKSPSKYHDIALLETETEINFSKDIVPACLQTEARRLYHAKVSSSDHRTLGPRPKNSLRFEELNEYNKRECAAMYPPQKLLKNGYDHETQMCFGRHDKVKIICEGYGGGPLLVKEEIYCLYTIVGVTSYSLACNAIGLPGMYTRVSYYVPWIENIVWPEEAEAFRKKDYDKIKNC